ncbi:MAG: hypothetical protein AAFR75_04385 [Pseudomonadota bacterium]
MRSFFVLLIECLFRSYVEWMILLVLVLLTVQHAISVSFTKGIVGIVAVLGER